MHLQRLQLILCRHVAQHVKSVCGQGQMILAHFRKQLITENIIGKVYLIAMLKISIIQKDKGTIDRIESFPNFRKTASTITALPNSSISPTMKAPKKSISSTA